MKVTCSSCSKPFAFAEGRFGNRGQVKVRCPACKAVVTLDRPAAGAVKETAKPAAAPGGSPTQKLKRDEVVAAAEGGEALLPMPVDKRISLAVLGGKGSGEVIPCGKSRIIIGRAGADVSVDDDEVSRRHAVLEIRDDRFFLKDLGSTNGTFVDERKITEAEIFDKGEFRVGTTQLMLIVTLKDDV